MARRLIPGLLCAWLVFQPGDLGSASVDELLPRSAQGLQLIYPRGGQPGGPIVLERTDSLLLNGNVELPRAHKRQLVVNGVELALTADGRFAGHIVFPSDLLLRFEWTADGHTERQTVTLALPENKAVTPPAPVTPGWYRTTARTNLSTAEEASYWLFPASGMPLEIAPAEEGGLTARLCDGLSAWLPGDTVLEPLASPPVRPCRVGNIVPLEGGWGLEIPIPGGPVPVRLESQPRQGVIRLLLPDAVAAIDRVRIDPQGPLQHLDWEPRPGPELELRLALTPWAVDGIGLEWHGDLLRVRFNRREAHMEGWRIVLDPGHGGVDTGCIAASGITESEVNLTLALEVGERLEQAGATVFYTRRDDRAVPLADRVAFADANLADFFLSLHHNSVPGDMDPLENRGFTVFYWNAFSAEPARLLHSQLSAGPLEDDGLLWRSLAVCRQEGRPAVLLETGYLIHPKDEDLILDPSVRARVARQIVQGLKAYLH